MPYRISSRDGRFCVIKIGDEQNMGCHPTRAEALAQMRAILANESTADPQGVLLLAMGAKTTD